ncbi:MAG: hypothetical protein HY789_14775 [Deltaproteobacteria bacterium]|nr:hypothetical protein [Deltaproteobacteria bacterium]
MSSQIFSQPGQSMLPAPTLAECLSLLGIRAADPSTLPFSRGDATAGTENELQVAVAGQSRHVDLPRMIESSNYYANIVRRARAGDTSPQACRNLERYISDSGSGVWENSWVRFPLHYLNGHARTVLQEDLRADKTDARGPLRSDSGRFFFEEQGKSWVRMPVSYLLKLALADAAGDDETCATVHATGRRLLEHFLSDNTSPETFSFHVICGRGTETIGSGVAREAAKRYLLSQLLILYANRKFALEENGQQALLFFSPHPPLRQRQLNENISDAFYRELFMNPCLAGWNEGEKKQVYMGLCHQVLSRSQINAVMKLREAGIIMHNLVVMPHTSNISLANNGTHISLGSRKLTRLMKEEGSGFTSRHEKYVGDLAVKIIEHFLPLFVGTYSAAPYRFDFEDFHPEKVLGFLAHQLDYTHLRMFWRRWKNKAENKIFGHSMTPFGPLPMDAFLAALFRLKGDFVPDFRLIDYPVSLLSTERNCCQDGLAGNDVRLKEDLDSLGVFDKRMSLYQLCKLREFATMGFSGFEARYYSLFENFGEDLAQAADLQMLLNALAFQYISHGTVNHGTVPGAPFIESERRQVFFGAAVGLPTFFVRRDTPNAFLRRILRHTRKIRPSHRYPGYLRVHNLEYRLGLLRMIRADGAGLIEMLGLEKMLAELENRILHPARNSACGKLVRGITGRDMSTRAFFNMSAREFNGEAERYYREDLRTSHMREAWGYLAEDVSAMAAGTIPLPVDLRSQIAAMTAGQDAETFLERAWQAMAEEDISLSRVKELIRLMLLTLSMDAKRERPAA